MKKSGLILAGVLALVSVSALAALDTYTPVTVTDVKVPKVATGTATNAAVDVAGAKGVCSLFVTIGPRTAGANSFTGSVSLTTCATSGGTYAAVSGATASGVVTTNGNGATTAVKVDAASLRRYVKLVTTAGTNSAVFGAQLLYSK